MSRPVDDSETSINSISAQLAGTNIANLFGAIDLDNIHGLNLSVPEMAKIPFKPWDERDDNTHFAESGVDDQLIIHVPFVQNVRLKSIVLKLGRGEATPRNLRIYANHSTIIDFADAETTKPQLNISLLEGETAVTEYPLHVAAFASINSVSIFFSNSVGGDLSRIYYIGFAGDVRFTRKDANNKLVIPAANAADAAITDRLAEKTGGQQTTAR